MNEGLEIIYFLLNYQWLFTLENVTSLFPKFLRKWNEMIVKLNRMRIKDRQIQNPLLWGKLKHLLSWQVFQLTATLHLLV